MLRVKSVSDWGMVIGVAVLSIGANLPIGLAQQWGIDRKYLLGGLICLVGVALVRYLKFTLVLVVAILAIGANLPSDMATEFGVDRHIMMFALISMSWFRWRVDSSRSQLALRIKEYPQLGTAPWRCSTRLPRAKYRWRSPYSRLALTSMSKH